MKRGLVLSLAFSLSLFLMSFSVPSSAQMQIGELIKPNPAMTATDAADKIAKVPSAADDQRTSRILNNLAQQSGWFPGVKIGVSNGVVTLDGRTKSAEQLSWLAKTADRLPTVIAVINKAQVEQPSLTDLSPAWNEFLRLVTKVKRALPLLLFAALLVAAFWFVSRYIYRGLHSLWGRQINNPFLLSTVTKITMVPVWLVLFYFVLQTAGLSSLAATVIGGTGAVGIILGFAFKDIAENYLSGLLLAIRSPFTKGDDITVAGYDGFVQALNMRGTTILAYDGTLILVPNSIVIQSVIRNRTTNPRTRLTFDIGIGAHDSAAKAIDVIGKTLSNLTGVLQEPAPWVVAAEMNGSSIRITSRFWIDSRTSSPERMRSNAIACVKETLLASGISIPDLAREIVFTDPLKIQRIEADVDWAASQNERLENARKLANRNLNKTLARQMNHPATGVNDREQIKRLAEGVDIMDRNADRELIGNAPL